MMNLQYNKKNIHKKNIIKRKGNHLGLQGYLDQILYSK